MEYFLLSSWTLLSRSHVPLRADTPYGWPSSVQGPCFSEPIRFEE